ncbi:MAG: hypothetical protein REI09_07060 [Candidatus Dactylopiibacterium sp.]|nr:hypothetical protein [Candidatus Dactylopiibacterium sp.]
MTHQHTAHPAPAPRLLGMSAPARLAGAAVILLLLWAAIAWALAA